MGDHVVGEPTRLQHAPFLVVIGVDQGRRDVFQNLLAENYVRRRVRERQAAPVINEEPLFVDVQLLAKQPVPLFAHAADIDPAHAPKPKGQKVEKRHAPTAAVFKHRDFGAWPCGTGAIENREQGSQMIRRRRRFGFLGGAREIAPELAQRSSRFAHFAKSNVGRLNIGPTHEAGSVAAYPCGWMWVGRTRMMVRRPAEDNPIREVAMDARMSPFGGGRLPRRTVPAAEAAAKGGSP